MKKNKILVVEHREEILKRITDILIDLHYIVYSTNEKNKGIRLAGENNVDVILIDVDIMQGSGLDLVAELKESEDTKFIPIVLVSKPYKDVEFIEKSNALEVDSIIFIPFDELDLISKINTALKIKEYNISSRKSIKKIKSLEIELDAVTLVGDVNLAHFLNQKIKYDDLIRTDVVTGLINKKEFFERLDLIIDEAIEYEDSLIYVLFEIDYLNDLKKSFDKKVLNEIFLSISDIIKKNTSKKDLVSKFDNDEFMIVYKRTTEDKVEDIVDDIKSNISKIDIFVDGVVVKFSVSAGLVCVKYKYSYRRDKIENEISESYIALMNAKRRGVSSVFVYPMIIKK